MSGYQIRKQDVALGHGHYISGYAVVSNGVVKEFFRHADQARRFAERANEELTRDG